MLIKIRAIGINPVDTYIRSNTGPLAVTPHVLGADGAGDVEVLGEGVNKFKVGDRVWIFFADIYTPHGTYAEYAAVPAEMAHHLPSSYSYEEGATLGITYMTAERALFVRCDYLFVFAFS